MIEEHLSSLVRAALEAAAPELGLPELPERIEFARPPQKEFGDFSTNVAFHLAKPARRSPRDVATAVAKHLQPDAAVSRVEVAGAGFLNFFVVATWLHDALRAVIDLGPAYGRAERNGLRVQVEFVSANPTGPLHIGHARNAVLGDALASVLDAAGWGVEREYYLNDVGRQMELFGRSVEVRLLERHGIPAEIPEGGYGGEYIREIAEEIDRDDGTTLVELEADERRREVLRRAETLMLRMTEATLARFGIVFDTFFSQRSLYQTGAIAAAIDRLRGAGSIYEEEGAVWFRSTDFGDDKDRVLIRSNGEPTYFAADCAYLVHKFERGFDHLIYVWGADHHGDVVRVKGAAKALGYDPEAVELILYQFVSFVRAGEPVKMSKRTGALVTLDELIDEVGTDAARYGMLSRSSDTAIQFDIEEAKRQTLDNPVYYVQYAHARIASILRHAEERGVERRPVAEVDLSVLRHDSELELLRAMAEWPGEIGSAANLRAPYRLTHYAEDLAARFHRFYADCRVVSDDAGLTQARLWLAAGAKQVVANVLGLIGVSAPEGMERAEEEDGG